MKHLFKAIAYALVIMILLALALVMMIWTKGLFIIALIFGLLVSMIYSRLKWESRTMRVGDRKW